MTKRATGIELRPRDGAVFTFDPGALWLELLVTGGVGVYARYETLHSPADLAGWASTCRLGLRPDDVVVSDIELDAVKRLRVALWHLTHARVRGEEEDSADRAVVNAAAARPPLAPVLGPNATSTVVTPVTGAQLASTVARDAIDVLAGPFAPRVRECAGDNCALVFVDTSRPGKRRWCAMERCGNRHKVRAARAREDKG